MENSHYFCKEIEIIKYIICIHNLKKNEIIDNFLKQFDYLKLDNFKFYLKIRI